MSRETVEQLKQALYYGHPPVAMWFLPDTLGDLALLRQDPVEWGECRAQAKRQGIDPWDLERAVAAVRLQEEDAQTFPMTLPHVPPPLMPPLPRRALSDPHLADGAAPWLDAYCDHSRTWAPRAANGFHQAVGLWMLSTVAARRICVELGSPLYPVLFLALVAKSTLYTKTTAARVGRDGVVDAGCACLLASDRSTPQALLKSMSGRVPAEYGSYTEEEQVVVQRRLAFAAQRGWYFEEWGGMLQQMARRDSPMADFHGLLRVLDDGYTTFATETIQRGLEHVDAPSLSILGSATPHDLGRFMEPGSAWWHDGFWPRFALIVPGPEELPSRARQPWGSARLPGRLLVPLHDWHTRLGIPEVTIEPATDSKGKPSGQWKTTRSTFPMQMLTVSPAVRDAYEEYNDGLMQLLTNGDAPEDLFACYGRLHSKALRIALLLASINHQDTISLPQWAYAQQVVERWRSMLHQVMALVGESYALSREEQLENKIESLVAKDGPRTARELHQYIKGFSSAD